MLEKYSATVRGDTIEWDGNRPSGVSDAEGLKVEVTVPSRGFNRTESDGKQMAAALAAIAARGGVESIPNPVAWQREIRKDRPLSGRE